MSDYVQLAEKVCDAYYDEALGDREALLDSELMASALAKVLEHHDEILDDDDSSDTYEQYLTLWQETP